MAILQSQPRPTTREEMNGTCAMAAQTCKQIGFVNSRKWVSTGFVSSPRHAGVVVTEAAIVSDNRVGAVRLVRQAKIRLQPPGLSVMERHSGRQSASVSQ